MKTSQELLELKSMAEKIAAQKSHRSMKEIAQITMIISAAVTVVLFMIFFGIVIYQNKVSIESIFSLLLAFFAIFTAVFFFFKADEAGKQFHVSSYFFMKEQSKLLGEINVRFAEKFDHLNTTNEKWQHDKNEKIEEIETNRKEITNVNGKLLNELKEQNQEYKRTIIKLEEAISTNKSTNEENQHLKTLISEMNNKVESSHRIIENYGNELEQKNHEYKQLQSELHKLEKKRYQHIAKFRHKKMNQNTYSSEHFDVLNPNVYPFKKPSNLFDIFAAPTETKDSSSKNEAFAKNI